MEASCVPSWDQYTRQTFPEWPRNARRFPARDPFQLWILTKPLVPSQANSLAVGDQATDQTCRVLPLSTWRWAPLSAFQKAMPSKKTPGALSLYCTDQVEPPSVVL